MNDEAAYQCGACGEWIVIPIDFSAGAHQQYVEDCPVCCRAHVLKIEVHAPDDLRVDAELE